MQKKVCLDWRRLCWKITQSKWISKLIRVKKCSPCAFNSEHTSYVQLLNI
jgi:hypothetical protein